MPARAYLLRIADRLVCDHTLVNGVDCEVCCIAAEAAAKQLGADKAVADFHNLLPDVPTENALALFEAYRRYGSGVSSRAGH